MEPTFTLTSLDTPPKDEPTLADALTTIGQGTFHLRELRGLSDLSRADVAVLARSWTEFPEEARIRTVQLMDELAEETVELNFGRVLRVALEDSSPAVRQLAIDALWEDDSIEFCQRLLSILSSEDSQDVRSAAAQGLARFADAAIVGELSSDLADKLWNALLVTAENESEPYVVRRRALESIAAFGSRPEVVDLIRNAYDADDAGFHAAALYAMGRTLDPRWLDILIEELESEDAEMRYEAARATGELGDVRAIPGLAKVAIDEDNEVRQEAIISLGRIGGKAAERELRRLAEDANETDQEAIAEALGEIVDEMP
jgi:HEAT repeat protein